MEVAAQKNNPDEKEFRAQHTLNAVVDLVDVRESGCNVWSESITAFKLGRLVNMFN